MHKTNNSNRDFNRAFAFGIGLNSVYIAAEVVFGLRLSSTALLADAGHNLSDVISLFLAWLTYKIAFRKPSHDYTYGLRRSTILTALVNAILLFIAIGAIGWEAVKRLYFSNIQIEGLDVSLVAFIGIVINGITAMLFFKGSKSDLNIRGAFLHMAADAIVSLGVVIAGALIYLTGYFWIDSVMTFIIILTIIFGTWKLFFEALKLSLDAVPKGISIEKVKNYLLGLEGISNVHDLHVWALSTTETAMTVHLVIPQGTNGERVIPNINHYLEDHFGINHTTIQLEYTDKDCLQSDCG